MTNDDGRNPDHHNLLPPSPQPLPSAQNWGTILGVGLVALCLVILLANLFDGTGRLERTPWQLAGWWAGIGVSLGGGGWLLWRLLRHRSAAAPHNLNDQVMTYIHKIERLLKNQANGHEQPLLAQLQSWQQTSTTLAYTLTDLSQHDQLLRQDLAHLPTTIATLERQVAAESDSLLRDDLAQMLAQCRHQQQALSQLQTTRRRAEIQMERTLAVLGTIYSQLLTYRSTAHVVDYRHLADHVAEEVQQLEDYLEALREVKGEA